MADFNYPLFPFLMPTGMMGPPLNPGSNGFTGEPAQYALPRNFQIGGSFDFGQFGANLNGTNLTETPYAIPDPGYYDLDVMFLEGDEGSITRFPIAVVDPTTLVVQLQAIEHTGAGDSFKQMVDRLPNVYAHGRAAPAFATPEYKVNVYVNQAVILEIRAKVGSVYNTLGTILCKGPGYWSSAPIALPPG